MRVAVCISGHLRTFERTYTSLYKNILKKYNCDCFISTWDTLGSPNSKGDSDKMYGSIRTDNRIDLINDIYSPKKIFIEDGNNIEKHLQHGEYLKSHGAKIGIIYFHPGYQISMFYKVTDANRLKTEYELENNFKYDAVIRFRSDILLHKEINIAEFDLNKITVPWIGNYEGINDQFAIGSSKVMDIYSNLYNKINTYCLDHKFTFRCENLLQYHLNVNSIPIVENNNLFYDIVRGNGVSWTQTRSITKKWP